MELNEPILSPAQLVIVEGNRSLREVEYEQVKHFASRASKERVSISNTNKTMWFQILNDDEVIGCCALYLAAKKIRIKGDWIKHEWRGKGFGEFITKCRMLIAKELDYKLIEVLTLHPHYYRAKGFTIVKETRKGVWLSTLEI